MRGTPRIALSVLVFSLFGCFDAGGPRRAFGEPDGRPLQEPGCSSGANGSIHEPPRRNGGRRSGRSV